MDNVFIKRLWRSMKYECVHVHAFKTGSELRIGLSRWRGCYNVDRARSKRADKAPDATAGGASPASQNSPTGNMIETRDQLKLRRQTVQTAWNTSDGFIRRWVMPVPWRSSKNGLPGKSAWQHSPCVKRDAARG
jgi:hypothetical protein